MVSTRSGKSYGNQPVYRGLPMWAKKRKRSTRSRGQRTGPKSQSRPRKIKGRVDAPTGFKGPCKTHTLDFIKTVHHDGRGAGTISNVARGDELGNREGRRIRISRVLMRGKVWLDVNNAAVPGSNVCKIWVMKDRRPGNELVAFNALMDMADSEPTSALIKVDYRDRFIVLRDMVYDLHGGKDFRVDEATMDEMIEVNCDTLYSHEDDGTLAHTLENSIVVYYACSDPRQSMQITAQCRVYFFDSVSN
ncbi:coat protein [Myrica rubra citlodavirus 1]|nr:coat protein [Myrica rubra citlodavirus 1]